MAVLSTVSEFATFRMGPLEAPAVVAKLARAAPASPRLSARVWSKGWVFGFQCFRYDCATPTTYRAFRHAATVEMTVGVGDAVTLGDGVTGAVAPELGPPAC
jgi:hypothetical protein